MKMIILNDEQAAALLQTMSGDPVELLPAEETLRFGGLEIDLAGKEVWANGRTVALTRTEFEVLSLLASHPRRLFSREQIISRLWKDAPFVLDRTVDVHIARLRKKMGLHGAWVTSRPGYGYKFQPGE